MASPEGQPPSAYLTALYTALAGGTAAVRDADGLTTLRQALARASTALAAAPADDDLTDTTARLGAVAAQDGMESAATEAAARFATPTALEEAVYLVRCLDRDAEQAGQLVGLRAYLRDADLPADLPELSTDQAALLPTINFALLWRDPERLAWLPGSFESWRRLYATTYLAHHAAFRGAIAAIADALEGQLAKVAALERLNSIGSLGPPAAEDAIVAHAELQRLFPCTTADDAVAAALTTVTRCPTCGFAAGHDPPTAEAGRVQRAIDRGLELQLARLGRQLAGRIIGRAAPSGGTDDKIDRFLDVVRASDLTGLTNVLDDDIVRFIAEVLAETEEPEVFRAVARSFPEVSRDNIDAAVSEFRRVLERALAASEEGRIVFRARGRRER